MLLTDFHDAIRAIWLLRLKADEWEVSRWMSDNSSRISVDFHEGFAPLECIEHLTGKTYPEIFDIPALGIA